MGIPWTCFSVNTHNNIRSLHYCIYLGARLHRPSCACGASCLFFEGAAFAFKPPVGGLPDTIWLELEERQAEGFGAETGGDDDSVVPEQERTSAHEIKVLC